MFHTLPGSYVLCSLAIVSHKFTFPKTENKIKTIFIPDYMSYMSYRTYIKIVFLTLNSYVSIIQKQP